MSVPAIRVDGVGKRYRLGTAGSATGLLSERVGQLLRGGRETKSDPVRPPEDFWALRDVSFEVAQGEAVGLIGHNGAGKSTLLKLLSRITPPTEGRIVLSGRVASLLEVGTGFHPELTGRENVYLNGAILGMRRREIAAKFDAIAEFSGVERFLDTPVKRYSSGMYVRLAFAVAAHLEPEILLIDEVLAVGDAEFQRKCLGRMQEVTEGGRTVIFVSHNLAAVRRLCPRSVLFESGRIALAGQSEQVVASYLERTATRQESGVAEIPAGAPREGDGRARLRAVTLLAPDGQPSDVVPMSRTVTVRLRYGCTARIADACAVVGISTLDGHRIATAYNLGADAGPHGIDTGRFDVIAEMAITLLPGEYVIDAALVNTSGATIDQVSRALRFTVLNTAERGVDDYPWATVNGHVRPDTDWTVYSVDEVVETT